MLDTDASVVSELQNAQIVEAVLEKLRHRFKGQDFEPLTIKGARSAKQNTIMMHYNQPGDEALISQLVGYMCCPAVVQADYAVAMAEQDRHSALLAKIDRISASRCEKYNALAITFLPDAVPCADWDHRAERTSFYDQARLDLETILAPYGAVAVRDNFVVGGNPVIKVFRPQYGAMCGDIRDFLEAEKAKALQGVDIVRRGAARG